MSRPRTRSELLKLRREIAAASKGRDLLEGKLNALRVEFQKTMSLTVDIAERVAGLAARASYSLAVARAVDGYPALKSVSLATRGEITVDMKVRTVMGVALPEIGRKNLVRTVVSRGYSPTGVSSRIDDAAERHEELLTALIELAGVETRLRRLAREIQRTRRRVNALDNRVLPKLYSEKRSIQASLEERFREDIFRLKRLMKARG